MAVGNAPAGGLPDCSIRTTCRWFGQIGEKACTVCPLVMTDNSADEAAPPMMTAGAG
jgi:hypothetical protein